MRVLQLLSSGGYYGAENMLLNLAASQEQAGCPSTLLLFYNAHQPNVDFYEQARRRGLPARMVRCEGRADWRVVRDIRWHIRTEAIDIVHAHGYKADVYGYLAARWEKKPIVATCHNWRDSSQALRWYNRLDRLVLKRFDAVGAVSEAVAATLRGAGMPGSRIKVIPNGVDVHAFHDCRPSLPQLRASGAPVIGVVARLDLQKGFEYLLQAVRGLCDRFSGLQVVIVGEGPDRAAIEGMVQQLGLESHVTLAGQRADMPGVYASMDIFVLPSLNEGLPMTVLEAMAASRVVVVTRVGAIPTVIADGETGLLVDPRDTSALTQAIARLLSDSDLREHLARQARAWVEQHYTADFMALKYKEIYERVLGDRVVAASAGAPHLQARKIKEG